MAAVLEGFFLQDDVHKIWHLYCYGSVEVTKLFPERVKTCISAHFWAWLELEIESRGNVLMLLCCS